jgi:site-specific DNA recombinase
MSAPTERVHIYTRVSSAGQEDGYSLDTQEAACRAWAQERGLVVATVAREVWSGADRHRPELDALLDRLLPGDVMIAYALDRLSRSQVDTAILIDRIETAGASLQLVTEDFEKSATGTFLRGAKAFAAELEREKISERTQRGRRARVANGKPIPGGKPPYGYVWADAEKTRLGPDPETAPVVRSIFDQALAGASLRAIVANLDARGTPTPYGRTSWTAASVQRVLTREMYSTGAATAFAVRYERKADGGYRQRENPEDARVRIADVASPLVSREEQAVVLARLATNKQFATRNNKHPETTLLRAGFVRCGHCGWAMRVNSQNSVGLGPKYCCNSYRHGRCPNPTITARLVDGPVWERVVEVLRDPRIIAAEIMKHREDGGLERDLAAIDKMLTQIAAKQTRTVKAITAVDDDDAAAPLIEELKNLSTRKTDAEREQGELRRRIADQREEAARVRSLSEWCATVATNLDTLGYDEKRLALEALGVQVRVWREDAMRDDGTPFPRWELTIRPVGAELPLVYPATSSTSGS